MRKPRRLYLPCKPVLGLRWAPLLQESDHHAGVLILNVSSNESPVRKITCNPNSDVLLDERRACLALDLLQGL